MYAFCTILILTSFNNLHKSISTKIQRLAYKYLKYTME